MKTWLFRSCDPCPPVLKHPSCHGGPGVGRFQVGQLLLSETRRLQTQEEESKGPASKDPNKKNEKNARRREVDSLEVASSPRQGIRSLGLGGSDPCQSGVLQGWAVPNQAQWSVGGPRC